MSAVLPRTHQLMTHETHNTVVISETGEESNRNSRLANDEVRLSHTSRKSGELSSGQEMLLGNGTNPVHVALTC